MGFYDSGGCNIEKNKQTVTEAQACWQIITKEFEWFLHLLNSLHTNSLSLAFRMNISKCELGDVIWPGPGGPDVLRFEAFQI